MEAAGEPDWNAVKQKQSEVVRNIIPVRAAITVSVKMIY